MLGFAYSLASYAVFAAVFVYFAAFSDGLLVMKHVDAGVPGNLPSALAADTGLLLLFGLQHSIMARQAFKRVWTRLIPAPLERSTYVLASTAVLAFLIWQWRPLPRPLWWVGSGPLAAALWLLNAAGWFGVLFSSFLIDHFELFGIKQAFHGLRGTSSVGCGFVTPLVYKYVRHPMMTAFFVGFWLTPHMTVGHLLLSAGMSVYILVGVHFEERALVRELGAEYLLYRATTPKFLPFGRPKRAGD